MDIVKCLKKIHPNWQGIVWNNSYEGIKPNATEKRPTPTLKELEAVWPIVQQEERIKITIDKASKEAKEKAVSDILPSWSAVEALITSSKNIDDLKKIVIDLAKIIYMTVKGAV
jgi:molecular chaperone GrpE (heat shock protein)